MDLELSFYDTNVAYKWFIKFVHQSQFSGAKNFVPFYIIYGVLLIKRLKIDDRKPA